MRVKESMRAAIWMMICIAGFTALCSVGALVQAQNPQADQIIKRRIADQRRIGKAFKSIRDELRAQNPALTVIRESAAQIVSLGAQQLSWFPPGTDKGQTHAKEEVWSERAAFEAAHNKFQGEAEKMAQLAQAGEKKEALVSQYRALGESCKNCHNTFRGRVEDGL